MTQNDESVSSNEPRSGERRSATASQPRPAASEVAQAGGRAEVGDPTREGKPVVSFDFRVRRAEWLPRAPRQTDGVVESPDDAQWNRDARGFGDDASERRLARERHDEEPQRQPRHRA